MADTTYNVRTVYSTDTRGAESGIDRLGALFDRVGRLLSGLKSVLFGLPTLIVAAFATGAIGAFLGRVVAVGGAAETARISLAGMVNAKLFATAASPEGNWAQALRASDALIARRRQLAAALPGSEEDLSRVELGSMSGGMSAGRSLREIQDVAARVMGVTKSFGIDSEQAGRDMTLMMEGRAGAQVATFARLRTFIGKTAEEFNAMTAAQRWEAISAATQRFGPMLRAAGQSWEGISSTALSYAEGLLRVGSAPLFEEAKSVLRDLNGWIERNRAAIERVARVAGRGLAEALSRAVEYARELGPILSQVAANPLFRRVAGIATGLANGRPMNSLTNAGAPPGGRGAATAAATGVGLAAGVPMLGLVIAALLEFATHTRAVDAVMASLAASGSSVLALAPDAARAVGLAAGTGGDAAAAALPGTFAGLGVVVETVVAYFHTLMAVLDPYLVMVGSMLTPVFAALGRVGAGLGGALGGFLRVLAMLTVFHLRQSLPTFERVVGVLLSVFASVLGGVAWFLEGLSSVFARLVALLNRIPGMRLESPRALGMPSLGTDENAASSDDNGWHRFGGGLVATGVMDAAASALNARLARGSAIPARGNTHVTNHVQVHQTIEQADDPDRVLVATRDAVLEAMLHPVESSSVLVTR